jgi:hypothetical protein
VARVLIEILPPLLLRSDNEVTALINMVHAKSGNGYDLLWRILELTIPGFDPLVPNVIPIWRDEDIFTFAQAILLYFRLQAKQGVYHDNRAQSTTFLTSIGEPAYINTITTLQMCINNFYSPIDDGFLPTTLCVMGLAH